MEKINRIKAALVKSKYAQEEHLGIEIDEKSLDQILEEKEPGYDFLGLVPTLLNWLEDEKARKVVWARLLETDKAPQIVPILMCPDDCDLFCPVVVVEIVKNKNTIEWKRFGIDESKAEALPEGVGTKVKWIKTMPKYTFNKAEYLKCITRFKDELSVLQ